MKMKVIFKMFHLTIYSGGLSTVFSVGLGSGWQLRDATIALDVGNPVKGLLDFELSAHRELTGLPTGIGSRSTEIRRGASKRLSKQIGVGKPVQLTDFKSDAVFPGLVARW